LAGSFDLEVGRGGYQREP